MFLFNLFYTKDLSSGVEVATKFEQLGFLFLFNPVILLLQCMFSFMFSQFVYIRIYVYIYIFGGSVGNITSKKYLCKTVIFLCTVYVFFYFLSICVHDVNVFFFWGEHCKKHTPQIVIFLFTGYFFFDDLWLCVHDVFFFFLLCLWVYSAGNRSVDLYWNCYQMCDCTFCSMYTYILHWICTYILHT